MIPDLPCRFTLRPLPENEGGGYLIAFPNLPGCTSDRATIEAAITNGLDAMRGWTPAMPAEGHPIPAPTRCADAGRTGPQCLRCMRDQPGNRSLRPLTIRAK
jgi:predicted RNase H-like HicB family nuclease